MQNRVQLREKLLRIYEKLVANMRNYESFNYIYKDENFICERITLIRKIIETRDAQGDLGNIRSMRLVLL